MNATDREQAIIEYLEKKAFASVNDLKQVLNASDATIRRDILKLHGDGALLKVFGGAVPVKASGNDRSVNRFSDNELKNVGEKRAIAKTAASLCDSGDLIIINGGTTCDMFARELVDKNLRVFTNSMPVATFLWQYSRCQLVISGGEINRESGILYNTDQPGFGFFASKYFLSAQAFGPEGIMESSLRAVKVIDGIINNADQIIVLCDSTKFDLNARFLACPIDRISTVITDSGIKDKTRSMLEDLGVRVILADV